MSTNYFILWENRSLNNLAGLQDVHFYAIESDGVLVYIGLSYSLDLEAEIDEAVETFRLDKERITLYTGNVVRNIHNYVNKQLAEEMVCLMVYNIKPTYNVICSRSYYGRAGLIIHNRGYNKIPTYLTTDKPYTTILSRM